MQAAQTVNEAAFHGLAPIDDRTDVRGDLPSRHHIVRELLARDAGIRRDKIRDLLLNALKIVIGRRCADHDAAHAHGVDHHAGRRDDHALLSRNGQRDADGVPAAQHERHGGLPHPGDQLRNGKSRLDVAAHGVEQEQQAVDVLTLLNRGQQRQHMLVFCCFDRLGLCLMALDLPDDRQGIDIAALRLRQPRAKLLQPLLRPALCFVHAVPPCFFCSLVWWNGRQIIQSA